MVHALVHATTTNSPQKRWKRIVPVFSGDRQDKSRESGRPRSQHNTGRVAAESVKKAEYSLVGAVDVVDGQDGQVAVITEVTQSDAATGLQLQSINLLLGDIEGNGHGEDIAIGKAAVLADTVEQLALIPSMRYRGRCDL